MCGSRCSSLSAAASTWACASASSSVGRSCSSVRCRGEPGVMPSTGVAGSAPTAMKCAAVSDAASMVMTPQWRPGLSANCSRLDVHTGTGSAACSSRCHSARKPQLVATAAQPWPTNARAASTKGCSAAGSRLRTTRSGVAPSTTRRRTGKAKVAACPTSPSGRGKRVCSISKPSVGMGMGKAPSLREAPEPIQPGHSLCYLPCSRHSTQE